MLRAKRYVKRVGVGVTAPCLIEADDGNLYVVKFKNNRLGTKVLVNELLAERLGKRLGLCFPPGGLIDLTEEFVAGSRRLTRRGVEPGLHFASLYLKCASYVRPYHLPFAVNRGEFAGTILFDHLLHNADRTLNGKNMLVQREKRGYRLYAIDNSHLFGSGRWRAERFDELVGKVVPNRRRAYGALLGHYLKPEDFAPYVAAFESVDESELAAIVAEIPAEWLADGGDKTSLLNFLVERFRRVRAVAAIVTGLIPNVHRRSE